MVKSKKIILKNKNRRKKEGDKRNKFSFIDKNFI